MKKKIEMKLKPFQMERKNTSNEHIESYFLLTELELIHLSIFIYIFFLFFFALFIETTTHQCADKPLAIPNRLCKIKIKKSRKYFSFFLF